MIQRSRKPKYKKLCNCLDAVGDLKLTKDKANLQYVHKEVCT